MTRMEFEKKHKPNLLKGFDDLDGRDIWLEFVADLTAVIHDERECSLTLIEAPIPGLLEVAEVYDKTGRDSKLFRQHAKTLEEAVKSARESARFREALEAKKREQES